MADIKPDTFPKYQPNRFLKDLPAYLKDPANYEKVNKLIIETLASKHSHGEVIDWAKCAACQRRFAERSV